jgi:hypothetical protein
MANRKSAAALTAMKTGFMGLAPVSEAASIEQRLVKVRRLRDAACIAGA